MELNLNFSDLKTFEEAVEIQRSLEGENSDIKSFGGTNSIKKTPGIYVLTPFKVPYYVGLSTVRGKKYWNLQRVIQHVKKNQKQFLHLCDFQINCV
ncbi:hypothetical protein [Algoriphagus boritolerans]|uniref:hypothetical protein n=1 Tax=Algoriphagus boritolerans TaxID=308111 RepID=UPI000AFD819E